MFSSKTSMALLGLAALLSVLTVMFSTTKWENHTNKGLNIEQLLEKYDYPWEEHTVVTEDGYILTLHRIPYGRNETKQKGQNQTSQNPPVLIMHCIMGSGMDYVLMGPGRAIGLLLADHGYDVWIANARGTPLSKRHTKWNPVMNKEDRAKYWNFSWHEIGKYDLPALIDYVLNETKQNNSFYIGTSQGSADFLVMMSERPEYNNKIRLMISIMPGVFMGSTVSPIVQNFAHLPRLFDAILRLSGMYDEFITDQNFGKLLKYACHKDSPFLRICQLILANIVGPDNKKVDTKDYSLIFPTFPTSCASKQIRHYLQVVKSDDFLYYDYDEENNLELYGQKKPPQYDLSKTVVPVAVFHAEKDDLMTTAATKRLIEKLPNVVYEMMLENMNHFETVYTSDIHRPLLEIINKFR